MKNNRKVSKYIFILTPFIFFSISLLIPLVTGIYASFTKWDGFSSPYDSKWIGLQNFNEAFVINHNQFTKSILFTIKISLVLIIFINLFSFVLAFLVTRPLKSTTFFRGAFFIPNLIGGIVVGFIWEFIFRTTFKQLGFGNTWLQDKNTGFWGIIILSIWQKSGYMMVIYIAAIQNIPRDVVEASKIDGASTVKKSFKIYFPYILPAFTVVTFMCIRFSFGLFDQVLALTLGGPNQETETIALGIYSNMFTYRMGAFLRVAQAQGVIYFIIVSAIAIFQVSLTKRGEFNG